MMNTHTPAATAASFTVTSSLSAAVWRFADSSPALAARDYADVNGVPLESVIIGYRNLEN